MKVLIIQNGELIDNKFKYSITTRRQYQSLKEVDLDVNILIIKKGFSLKTIIYNIKKIRYKFSYSKPDIIHAHYGSLVSFICLFIKLHYKVGFVISFCGSDLISSPNLRLKYFIKSKISILLSIISYYFADEVICKSHNLRLKLIKLPFVKPNKIYVIPNGINTHLFHPLTKTEKNDFKNKFKWDKDKFVILFNNSSGNSSKVKNLPLAMRVLNKLEKKSNSFKLLVVGNIPPEDMIKYIQLSDCLILTSFHEGSPNIVKESMACNTPVVSVNCGDVKSIMNSYNRGFVTTYSSTKIANHILTIFKNNFTDKPNGQTNLKLQNLDETSVALKIINLYNKVLK